MKVQSQRKTSGFTLIEMIGVLAVIAILAALLLPKVFEAINNARINNAAVSYNTVKTAVADHYAKFGSLLGTTGGATMTAAQQLAYDKTLVAEGFLDKPFEVKIGNTWAIQANVGVAVGTAVDAVNVAYDLDGVGGNTDLSPSGAVVIEAVITGVTPADAKDLNDRLDGPSLGILAATEDLKGRVKYGVPNGSGLVSVRMYVTHR